MRLSIGIIAAERSVELIRKAHDEMSRLCGITYLPYSSLRNLTDIYERSAHLFDGLIFSGRFPCSYIVSRVGDIQKPYAYFELMDRDYYRAFAGILYRFPGIRVSRILIDRPYSAVDFGGVFGGDVPMFFDPLAEDDPSSLEAAYERTLRRYVELWRRNKIDLAVTRFANLAEMLGASGVPFELLFPSEASMVDVCGSLFSLIQSRKLASSMVASGIVSRAEPRDAGCGEDIPLLLDRFNESLGMSLVVRRNGVTFELTTSNVTLKDITRGYTDCSLTSRIHSELGEGVCVGWGLGADIVSSGRNAMRALRESMRSSRHCAYLVNDQGDLIGPMAGGKSVAMPRGFSPGTEEIGRSLKISPANLQRMISMHEHRGISSFSSADLAFYLNVTRRSAARILSRLAEHGWASVARHDHPNAKGRPYKIYAVNFGKLSSGAGE